MNHELLLLSIGYCQSFIYKMLEKKMTFISLPIIEWHKIWDLTTLTKLTYYVCFGDDSVNTHSRCCKEVGASTWCHWPASQCQKEMGCTHDVICPQQLCTARSNWTTCKREPCLIGRSITLPMWEPMEAWDPVWPHGSHWPYASLVTTDFLVKYLLLFITYCKDKYRDNPNPFAWLSHSLLFLLFLWLIET